MYLVEEGGHGGFDAASDDPDPDAFVGGAVVVGVVGGHPPGLVSHVCCWVVMLCYGFKIGQLLQYFFGLVVVN